MKKWLVVVLVEPDKAVEAVEVNAHSETDAKPRAVHKLLTEKYRNKGCRLTVAEVNELPS